MSAAFDGNVDPDMHMSVCIMSIDVYKQPIMSAEYTAAYHECVIMSACSQPIIYSLS